MDDGDYPITSLVDAAAAGDEEAWHEIVDRYTPLLGSVIRRFRLATAETQDVAQTVWLRLLEHLASLREPRALPMWIMTTGKRESLRYLSARRRTVPYDLLDPLWLGSSAEDAEPVAERPRAERHEALLAGLAELPARQRELLLLLVEDPPLSYAQIALRTAIPTGSIGLARGRALERLRQTFAVRDHLAGPARVPVVSDGASPSLDRTAARDLDRPRER
ncbi:MAG TPA: sigma-70 family RNA polymerase sigma factor [Streptosporangiaceae bacterium]|jgi:RNA polymerase sigma factor (sigma-70 family)